MMPNLAYVALGSNLNDPRQQVTQAIQELAAHPRITLCKVSQLYQTKAQLFTAQPDFINAVAKLATDLSARELFTVLQQIEQQHQRQRSVRFGPRTLDLDLLLFNQERINEPDLIVPHPAMWERDFVLIPLAEIEPTMKKKFGSSYDDKKLATDQEAQ